jgi:hypothetical protein
MPINPRRVDQSIYRHQEVRKLVKTRPSRPATTMATAARTPFRGKAKGRGLRSSEYNLG